MEVLQMRKEAGWISNVAKAFPHLAQRLARSRSAKIFGKTRAGARLSKALTKDIGGLGARGLIGIGGLTLGTKTVPLKPAAKWVGRMATNIGAADLIATLISPEWRQKQLNWLNSKNCGKILLLPWNIFQL